MIRDRAPDQVSPRSELQVQVGSTPGVDDADAGDVTRTDPLQPQIVLVLAEVRQLDHRVARLQMRARERERVFRRDDLGARERDAAERERGVRTCRERPQPRRGGASLDQRDALEPVCARDDPRRVESEPLLEQRRVDRSGSRRSAFRLPSASRPVESPGNSPICFPAAREPIRNPVPAAPWSVPPEPFSCARRPNSDQTSVSTRSATPRASRSRWNA